MAGYQHKVGATAGVIRLEGEDTMQGEVVFDSASGCGKVVTPEAFAQPRLGR